MSHILIFRDNFENMLLVTITGYSWNYQRQAVINEERVFHSSKGWDYAACYETDKNKTYLVFTKEAKPIQREFEEDKPYEDCKTYQQNSGRLPIYC